MRGLRHGGVLHAVGHRGVVAGEFLHRALGQDDGHRRGALGFVFRLPIGQPAFILVVRDGFLAVGGTRALGQSHAEGQRCFVGARQRALRLGEPRAGVNAVTLRLGNHPAAGVPRVVGQFKFRADRAGGDELPAGEIAGDKKFLAVPDADAAAAPALADAVIVHELAVVEMVMLRAIHRVHGQLAVLFDPHVGAAADGFLRAQRQRPGIGAVRDAVAFPREVVEALRHKPGKSFYDGRRHGGQRSCVHNVKRPRLARREVNLEYQFRITVFHINLRIQNPRSQSIHHRAFAAQRHFHGFAFAPELGWIGDLDRCGFCIFKHRQAINLAARQQERAHAVDFRGALVKFLRVRADGLDVRQFSVRLHAADQRRPCLAHGGLELRPVQQPLIHAPR